MTSGSVSGPSSQAPRETDNQDADTQKPGTAKAEDGENFDKIMQSKDRRGRGSGSDGEKKGKDAKGDGKSEKSTGLPRPFGASAPKTEGAEGKLGEGLLGKGGMFGEGMMEGPKHGLSDDGPASMMPGMFQNPGGGQEQKEGNPMVSPSIGGTVLDGMNSQSKSANQAQAAQGANASRNDIAQNVQKIADQILVSKPDDTKQEVRIQLKAGVLDGAELTVRRDANGLTIKFEAKTFESAQRIDQIVPQLQQHMQRRSNDPVNVEVDVQERQQDSDEDDQRQGSKNKIDYEDDDEDPFS